MDAGAGFEAELLAVVDRIYAAPFDDGGWEAALTGVSDFVGAQCADLSFIDPATSGFIRVESARIDTTALGRYLQDFLSDPVNNVPRVPHCLALSENGMFADSDVWTRAERNRMGFFTDLMHPTGLHDALMALPRKTADGRPWLLLATHFDQNGDGGDKRTRARLRAILPHVRRACEAEERLAESRREVATLAEALDKIKEAVALVDRSCKVVRSNDAAESVFRSGGIGLACDKRLILVDAAARENLMRALGRCASPILWTESAGTSAQTQIAVSRQNAHPLILTVHPLPRSLAGTFGAVAMLFIADPQDKARDHRHAVQMAYGLSDGETRLVQDLSMGLLLKQIAVQRGVSYETVRAQLKRVMDKTGTHRQAEVVRLAQNLR